MPTFIRDLTFGFRLLRRHPTYAAIAVFTLALGIGANAAVFSVFNALLVRPLPFRDPGRLAFISIDRDNASAGTYEGTYEKLAAESRSFEQLAVAFRNTGLSHVTLTAPGEPEGIQGGFVSASLFPLLGVTPMIGRALTADDEQQRARVVVLGAALWKQRFGGSRDAIGQTIEIDAARWQVVGVMPDTFVFPADDVRFWAPITAHRLWNDSEVRTPRPNSTRGFYARWTVIGRLAPGASFKRAGAELTAIAAGLPEMNPLVEPGTSLYVIPPPRDVTPATRVTLQLLMGAVLTVLLIGCSNVANLTLARGTSRLRELAVRSAIGAGRRDLLRQLFAESLALALVAGGIGLLIAMWATPVLTALGPPEMRRPQETWVDASVLAFTAAVSIATSIAFGLIPAWKISRADTVDALRSGSLAAGHAPGTKRLRSLLIVVESALAVVLLAAAGLLVRSLVVVRGVDPGFRADHVLTLRVTPPSGAPATRRAALFNDVRRQVAAVPGVSAVGGIDTLFEASIVNNLGLRAIDGRDLRERREDWSPMTWGTIAGDYFQAIGIPLIKGRMFSAHDDAGSPLVALIDESAAHRYWADAEPIGQRFKGQDRRAPNDAWITVIGVVGDARRQGLDRSPIPHIYLWAGQTGGSTSDLIVRSGGSGAAAAAAVRTAVRSADRTAIVSRVSTLESQLDEQLAPRRFQTWLIGAFSLLALMLAGAGVYGVMHYAVAERRREMAIRVALGARPADVALMVIRESMGVASLGLALGLVGAAWTGRLMAHLLYGVGSADPLSYGAAAAVLFVILALASWIPARRAVGGELLLTLRAE
jgi:predicted permease